MLVILRREHGKEIGCRQQLACSSSLLLQHAHLIFQLGPLRTLCVSLAPLLDQGLRQGLELVAYLRYLRLCVSAYTASEGDSSKTRVYRTRPHPAYVPIQPCQILKARSQ